MIAPPPASGFRLVRYFTVASLAAFLLVAAPLLYFERTESDFFKQVQQEQNAFFAQVQDSFARQHHAAAHADLLKVHEAGNVNLTRLFANALWEKDFAPFVAKVQRIPVDQCRAIGDVKDAGGRTVQPREKKACYAGIGKQIMAFPEFRALDAKVFDTMKKSTVFKIKVYDLRGITAYSSEHNQIGEDKIGNAGWESAMAGKPASELTHRDKFSAFEGVVENRDLIESYVPVLAPGSDKIAAVFEVYSDVTQFLDQIKNTSSQIQKLGADNQTQVKRTAAATQDRVDANANLLLAIVLGLLALLYCALLLVVRHGQRTIDKQDFERERAEEALAKSEARYHSLFVNIIHGFAYCRMLFKDNRPQDFIYLDVNIAFEKLTGLKNVVGKRVTEVIPGIREAHPELFETFGRVVLTGQPERFELYFKPLESWRSIVVYSTGEGTFVAIFDDITERKQTEQVLHDSARRLQGLSRRLFVVEETARRNINRELHDRIGQSLSALNISLNIIRSQLPQESLDVVGARFRDTQTLLEGTAVQIRDIMADLHPPALDDYGLLAALRTYGESFGARVAVPITVHGQDLTPRLSLAAETALFRIAQEALANAVTHGRAKRIQVMLAATPDGVTLTIADDGAGFVVARTALVHASWGLPIMRERAEAVGARLTVESTPGKGTRVVVEIKRGAA